MPWAAITDSLVPAHIDGDLSLKQHTLPSMSQGKIEEKPVPVITRATGDYSDTTNQRKVVGATPWGEQLPETLMKPVPYQLADNSIVNYSINFMVKTTLRAVVQDQPMLYGDSRSYGRKHWMG